MSTGAVVAVCAVGLAAVGGGIYLYTRPKSLPQGSGTQSSTSKNNTKSSPPSAPTGTPWYDNTNWGQVAAAGASIFETASNWGSDE